MSHELLQVIWFILVFVLLIGYAVLDGFDLGVGVLQAFARDDRERRVALNAIGPVWDGNEVWLITAGGALFAAFPPVYASVFSGFYVALMLLLTTLILRAVSIEFRSKLESAGWRTFWDGAFCAGSAVSALLLGVAFGNVLRGIPLDEEGNFTGTFFGLLNPYSVLIGVLTVVVFTLHGAIYLAGKTDGEHHRRLVRMLEPLWQAALVLYLAATAATFYLYPHLFEGVTGMPLFWTLVVVLLGSIIALRLFVGTEQLPRAFAASTLLIAAMIGLAAVSLFPRLVPATDPLHSLTAFNSSSSQRTLGLMLGVAAVGVPIVIAYSAIVYRVFRGKVVLTADSY